MSLYSQPYEPAFPTICVDEKPYQLLADTTPPLPCKPGRQRRQDDQYERCGSCNLFLMFEPKTGRRVVEVTPQRTKKDFAHWLQKMACMYYPEAKKIRIVTDNLNTHNASSFYETFEAKEARRLTELFEFHYTPLHASWLNMCEIEFSILQRQCLGKRRLSTLEELRREVTTWQLLRNVKKATIDWSFDLPRARSTFVRRYPSALL